MGQPRHLAEQLERALRAHGDPKRSAGAKRYLKSELEFIGIATPPFRAAVTSALAGRPAFVREDLLAVALELWRRPVFELKAVAVELIDRHKRLLAPGDVAVVEKMVRESHTWALVDSLAIHVAGDLVVRYPELATTLDRWAGDGDFWVRRAAMLALLLPLRRGAGDFDRFARYADAMLDEREFFIRKAIGWVLREVAKKRPELVTKWLRPRAARASGVTMREAVKYLPEDDRAALLDAWGVGAGRRRTRKAATGKGRRP